MRSGLHLPSSFSPRPPTPALRSGRDRHGGGGGVGDGNGNGNGEKSAAEGGDEDVVEIIDDEEEKPPQQQQLPALSVRLAGFADASPRGAGVEEEARLQGSRWSG